MAKLHVVIDAIRSERARLKLIDMIGGGRPMHDWRLRVEPALSRAVDFFLGEGFGSWEPAGGRFYLKLTSKGEIAVRDLLSAEKLDDLDREKIAYLSKNASEGFVSALIGFGKFDI